MIIAGLFIELADEEVFFTEGDFQLFGSREKKIPALTSSIRSTPLLRFDGKKMI